MGFEFLWSPISEGLIAKEHRQRHSKILTLAEPLVELFDKAVTWLIRQSVCFIGNFLSELGPSFFGL